MEKSRIYTKAGDKGETSLFGGQKVKKSSQRVTTYGSLDELNAALAVAASFQPDGKVVTILKEIQNELFNIGAEISGPEKSEFKLVENRVIYLENLIDEFEAKLPKLTNFILPGGSKEASFLHLARTVCRRAERELVRLTDTEEVNPIVIKYINRLSDLLFVLARKSNGGQDVLWKKD